MIISKAVTRQKYSQDSKSSVKFLVIYEILRLAFQLNWCSSLASLPQYGTNKQSQHNNNFTRSKERAATTHYRDGTEHK